MRTYWAAVPFVHGGLTAPRRLYGWTPPNPGPHGVAAAPGHLVDERSVRADLLGSSAVRSRAGPPPWSAC